MPVIRVKGIRGFEKAFLFRRGRCAWIWLSATMCHPEPHGHPSLAVDHSQLVGQPPMSSNFCGARRTDEESSLAVAWSTLAASDSWPRISFLCRFFVLCATVDCSLRTREADNSGVLNRFCQQFGVCRNDRAALSRCCFPNS